MKKLSILILGLLVITGFTFAQSITVSSPNGGETLTRGDNFSITWTSSGVTGNVNLILWKGSSNLGQIAQNKPANGSFSWPVGDALVNPPGITYPDGTDYKVMVKSIEDWTISDESNGNFTITTPGPAASITVTSPNGGENLEREKNFSITWTSSGVTGNVNLILWKGSANLGQIAQNKQANGSYSWPVGDALVNPPGVTYPDGSDYRVMVKSVNDGTISDESNGNFIIKQVLAMMIKPLKAVAIQPPKPDLVPLFNALIDTENYHYFQGTIQNRGQVEVKDPGVKIQVRGPGGFRAPTYYTTVQGVIKPDRIALFHWKYNVPNLKERGAYNFILTADPHDKIKESNENNNTTEFSFEFDPKSDLIVCTSNNKRPRVGYKTQVHAIVKNIGYQRSGSCKLRFYIEKKGSNEYDIPALNPGASHTITREVKWGLAGTKTISAIIDYYKKIYEYREDNNRVVSSYFVRLPHHKKTTHEPYSICSRKAFDIPW